MQSLRPGFKVYSLKMTISKSINLDSKMMHRVL